MTQVKTVFKGSTVNITASSSYTAVGHDDVTKLLHDPITNARIVAMASMDGASVEQYETSKEYNGKVTKGAGYISKVWASVTFIDIDKPDDRFTVKSFAYALDSGDKAVGKAYSMAVKYCYLKGFMLESSDDEESRDNENTYNHNPSPTSNEPLATAAQKEAIKKIYASSMHLLEGIDPQTLTKKKAGELITNAPKQGKK